MSCHVKATTEDPELQTLFDNLQGGDPTAIGKIHQKFSDKYLGGKWMDQ